MDSAGPVLADGDLDESLHVLYLDDEGDQHATIRSALRSICADVTVHCAPDAAAAFRTLESEPIECLVSEYTLPQTDGLEFVRDVRSDRPTLPIVVVTADGDERVASEALGAGATDYLPKSVVADHPEQLSGRVADLLTERTEREAILDRMTDAFFALDTGWEFTYLNGRGREAIETAADENANTDELVGKNIWEVVPDAVGTKFYDEYHRAMRDQASRSFEAEYEPAATRFEVNVYPSPTGLSVYFRDVTDRYEREQSLIERECVLTKLYRVTAKKELSFDEKVDRLLEIGRDVLGTEYAALSRIDGDEYVFEYVYDPDGETQPGDVVPLETTHCERAVLDAETLVLEDVAEQAPGLTDRAGFVDQGVVCYLGTPVRVDGDVYGTFCFYDREVRETEFDQWEVTLVELMGNWISYEEERRRREQELKRERNRLDDFASVVSHDLRNPLNLAIGRADMLDAELDGESAHLDAISNALDRMEALIEDVLTLARSGDYDLERTTVDVETVVTDAWAAVDSDGGTLTFGDDLGSIEADARRVKRLFENLCRNSVEHGGDDVTVVVDTTDDGFYVADDGPGIPPGERETVLERGYTTSETGTGFGLPIVAEVAHAHGWEIDVTESDRGGARIDVIGV